MTAGHHLDTRHLFFSDCLHSDQSKKIGTVYPSDAQCLCAFFVPYIRPQIIPYLRRLKKKSDIAETRIYCSKVFYCILALYIFFLRVKGPH